MAVADMLSHGPERPPRRPPRWAVASLLVVLVTGAVTTYAVRNAGDDPVETATTSPAAPHRTTRSMESRPVDAAAAALVIDGRVVGDDTLDRRDTEAAGGPQTTLIRRADGALGRHGAVVTFPAERSTGGRAVSVRDVTGSATDGAIVWPVGGSHARVRGDLSRATLLSIARGTRIVGYRPHVDPPTGFEVAATVPYRSAHVREVRYRSSEVRGAGPLDGPVYTGVSAGGGFEDQLYAQTSRSGGTVHSAAAVVSRVQGGNATLAWELRPGLVAYVGYSGMASNGVEILRRLAERTQGLDMSQWQATDPSVSDQVNDYS